MRVLDGDYNAVEARIICWEAGEEEALKEYCLGLDRYQIMATEIYQRDLSYIKSLGKDSTERQVGKHTILGCGFGMGRAEKFQDTCWKQGGIRVSEELALAAIKGYRRKHKAVVKYWWYLDQQCKNAVKTPGVRFGPFEVRKISGIKFLLFHLRSGRPLCYPKPEIKLFPYTPKLDKDDSYDPLDENGNPKQEKIQFRENVVYWGEVKSGVWGWVKLYGGKLAENETQATAADIMGYGGLEAERQGMPPFMLVHDQALALVTDPARHTPEAFEKALGTLPPWAEGLPLKVEAKITEYYRK